MNSKISGLYFDGLTSIAHAATLESTSTGFVIELLTGPRFDFLAANARFLDKIGSAGITLEFNRLARFQADPVAAEEQAMADLKTQHGGKDFIHELESRWKIALTAIVVLLVGFVFFYRVALPAIAKNLAFRVPYSAEQAITARTIEAIDKSHLLGRSQLPMGMQFQVQELSVKLNQYFPQHPITILLRHGGNTMKANAFALPDGNIFVTDEIVKVLTEQELLAVLFHEMGHVAYKHGIRSLIEGSAISAVMLALSGNIDWTGLPIALLSSGYSRKFESEADRFAIETLKAKSLNPALLGQALRKIDVNYKDDNRFLALFSSHPSTKERIETIENH